MTVRTALIVAALTVCGAASADELTAMTSNTLTLGDVSATVSYTVENDGYHVTATLLPGESGPPVRFMTVLLSGQRAVVSLPRDDVFGTLSLEFFRDRDRLIVTPVDPLG